nr:hypothetical protein [Pseudomonadota bacterium]
MTAMKPVWTHIRYLPEEDTIVVLFREGRSGNPDFRDRKTWTRLEQMAEELDAGSPTRVATCWRSEGYIRIQALAGHPERFQERLWALLEAFPGVDIAVGMEDVLKRMMGIGTGRQSNVLGDPDVLRQFLSKFMKEGTDPILRIMAKEAIKEAEEIREHTGFIPEREYPHVTMDVLTGYGRLKAGDQLLVYSGESTLGGKIVSLALKGGFDVGVENDKRLRPEICEKYKERAFG